ncbi:MAG: 3-oxoacyl-ACP reductase [Oceanospirillales bacterium LUC14_002_19_P2]|nr:MAG: 3-oxoacyl-ACP reductase [Oceanospirillales bacterium LUC14_002_19_P2]
MDLRQKAVLVTGAARGLGRSIAVTLASTGCRLALADLDQNGLSETKQLCTGAGSDRVERYITNVSSEDDVIALISSIKTDFGSLNALVNNAGILRDGLLVKVKDGNIIDKLSLAQWQSVIDVNLTGVFLCGREAATQMIEQGTGGVIINISSIARAGNFGQTNYAAAKAGVVAMTVSWARELARYGIRSAAIAPGMIETEMTAAMKPEAQAKMTSIIPMQRMGQPEEIANTVRFILENDYISGRVIEVDGGLRI